MVGNMVTWSGTIADLEAISDSIVVYGIDDYNGEDWMTISTDKKDMMPHTFIVELEDEGQKNVQKPGDKELQYNWKLNDGEVENN